MKRTALYISSALLLIVGLCISCQKEQNFSEENGASVNEVIVKATISGAATKVSFTENGTDTKLKAAWDNDDKIVGWDEEGNAIELEIASIDNGTAIFKKSEGSAAIPSSGKVYMIYAPGKSKSDISNKSLEYSLADQGSSKLPALMTATGTVSNNVLSLSFTNQLAIVAVKNPTFPVTAATAITGLKLSGSNIQTKATFSMDEETLKMEPSEEGDIARGCSFTTEADGTTTETMVYFAVLPNSTAADITVSTTTPTGYQISFQDKSFAAGQCYLLDQKTIGKQKFTLTADATTNGSISFTSGSTTIPSGTSVEWDTEVTVTATPDAGYELATLTYNDGTNHDIKDDKSFNMPQKNVTVNGTFKKKVFTFTVDGSVTKVSFAPGNLYAKKDGTNWTWGFYDKQYQFNSLSMPQIDASGGSRDADSGDSEIDLFCWGYDSTKSTNYNDQSTNSSFTDWGSISGLPSAPGDGWRTLTSAEWTHLLNTRTTNCKFGSTTDTNARYLKCAVKCDVNSSSKDVYGLMIFPDTFTWPTEAGDAPTVNNYTTAWTSVPVYTTDQFTALEGAGVVFLPAAGYRYGTSVDTVGSSGSYWSSTANGSSNAYSLNFDSSNVNPASSRSRYYGRSVRLVSVVQ